MTYFFDPNLSKKLSIPLEKNERFRGEKSPRFF